ncbi:MAG: methionyl-tRNA formyltransferase, partial [Phycisphaerae bacterium]
RLGESIDAGPILLQRPVAIGPEETAGELHDRLARLGPELIRQAIRLFQSGPDPPSHPQDPRRACPAPKLTKADGLIRFDQPAQVVAQRIRGLWPWPGAACRFVSADATRSETVTLARAVPAGEPAPNTDLPPGTISQQLTVACQPGHLRIIELRPAGSRLMSYQPDFVNGRRVRPADRFEPLS